MEFKKRPFIRRHAFLNSLFISSRAHFMRLGAEALAFSAALRYTRWTTNTFCRWHFHALTGGQAQPFSRELAFHAPMNANKDDEPSEARRGGARLQVLAYRSDRCGRKWPGRPALCWPCVPVFTDRRHLFRFRANPAVFTRCHNSSCSFFLVIQSRCWHIRALQLKSRHVTSSC